MLFVIFIGVPALATIFDFFESPKTSPKSPIKKTVTKTPSSNSNYLNSNKPLYKAVGVTFENRQENVKKLIPNELIYLVPEKNNPYDPNALLITNRFSKPLGYVSKEDNAKIRASLPSNFAKASATVNFIGSVEGRYGFNYYVNGIVQNTPQFTPSYNSRNNNYYDDDDYDNGRSHWDDYDEDGVPYSDYDRY